MDSGLQTDLKPFMIPDNAFAELKNAYVYRGRVRKRFGSELSGNGAVGSINQTLFSRCSIDLSTLLASSTYTLAKTDGAGDFTGYADNVAGFHIGQKFVISTDTYTVSALGTPAALTSSGAGSGTLNTTTGALTFTGTTFLSTDIVFYPYFTTTGLTDGAGVVNGWVPGSKYKIGQQFSIGDVVFTAVSASGQMLRTDGSLEVATYDTVTGEYSITIAALPTTEVLFYPSDPITGFAHYETTPVNNQLAFAFDTQFTYSFNPSISAGRWIHSGPALGRSFHGDDSEFFWTCNYQGLTPNSTAMFVTNFHVVNKTGAQSAEDDPIWYWNGTTWNAFAPIVITTPEKRLVSARIILPFKRRLLMLDTVEQTGTSPAGVNVRYQNRCRYSQDGSPLDPYAWLEPNQLNYQGGGWVDAATQEGIISAEYIKDRLVVYFERSTWELAYTGNEIEPFVWNKLNTELGSESPFSTVAFDKAILTVGANGIHACNGSNVERIDKNIPNYVFKFNNDSDGTARVHGIRDFKTEMVYWSVPLDNKSRYSYFPNTILTYNYKTSSWGENDDCITAWGYFEQSRDKTWAEMTIPWEECNFSWNSYVSIAKERMIIAGNQQGYIFIINPALTSNARNMTVANFVYDPVTRLSTVTVVDHTLNPNDWVKLHDINGITFDPLQDEGIHKVITATKDTFTLMDCVVTGTPSYVGGGTVSRVSKISIKSKQWNFFIKGGRNFLVNKMDFLIKRSSGKLVTDFAVNSMGTGFRAEAILNGMALGNYTINLGATKPTNPLKNQNIEELQDRIWRSAYLQAEGNFIQLFLTLDDDMMKKNSCAFSDLDLYAIMIYAKPTAKVMEVMNDEF
jgi:hypothetical protein